MPRVPKRKSALRKARDFLSVINNSNCGSSDSEESTTSIESGDLAHIPIKNLPEIENISIEGDDKIPVDKFPHPLEEDDIMDQIGSQLERMMAMMADLNSKQQQQDGLLLQLQSHMQNAAAAVPPAPVVPVAQPTANFEQLFKIPDPIKMLPVFDGNAKQLNAWLATAEETLNAFVQHVTPLQYKMYVTAVTNKIQGKARDIICLAGNPDDFEQVKEVLINALGDRQELSTYKCQLWQCRMTEGMSISKYYNKSKAIIQNIKTLAKQKDKYRNNWEIINEFIEEDALAAFISGLCEPYFGYAQAARPKDIEDAYAFLCKFKSKEIAAHSMAGDSSKRKYQKNKELETKSNRPSGSNKNYNQKAELQNKERFEQAEPMDATTTRSRLTVNKKQLNNNETVSQDPEDENSESSQSESDDDDLDLNFHSVFINQSQT